MDDITLTSILRRNIIENKDNIASNLYQKLERRDLYKRALYINSDLFIDPKNIEFIQKNIYSIEREISSIAGLNDGDVLIDIPSDPNKINFKFKIKEDFSKNIMSCSKTIKNLFELNLLNFKFGVFTEKKNINKIRKVVIDYFNL